MDELARYNKERWEELVGAGILYSRPWLDLDAGNARQRLGLLDSVGDLTGQKVLLLAGGGGQQSAGFALLGAHVTVLDLAEGQLAAERRAAEHYAVQIETVQGDMRDLSAFAPATFDLVFHPYAINYVPDAVAVFRQVARVLRPGGYYRLGWHNPYVLGLEETHWDGRGYPLRLPYMDGECPFDDPDWIVDKPDGSQAHIRAPRMFRHTFATVVNGLAGLGFVILRLAEEGALEPYYNAAPGTWEHFCAVVPPYLALWTCLQPAAFPH
jgi:SAM-dependent methyltransferase